MTPRVHGRLGRLGALLVRKRGLVLGPLFLLAPLFARRAPDELALEVAALALVLVAWALRVWAMGYRNWVRGPGARHLMTRGPYAWIRHPRYLANFLAGAAWFLLAFDPWTGLAYVVIYSALLGVVIVREEEKLAQDYPGHAAWQAQVPLIVPRPWRRFRHESPPSEAERWEVLTVLSGKELLKLALALLALAALAWGRRSGEVFALLARVTGKG